MHSSHFYEQEEWNLEKILSRGRRFRPIPRVSAATAPQDSITAARYHYENSGIPLIIEDMHKHPRWLRREFTPAWFKEHGQEVLEIRNIDTREDLKMSAGDFFDHCRASRPSDRGQRPTLYAKDAKCPDVWRNWLSKTQVVPLPFRPLGENDLLKYLPSSMRPETLMCYLGTGGTYTPCHKDLCGSSGHNLMLYTEDDSSAFWFMTKSDDAPTVAKYFQQKLHQTLDWEQHAVTIDELSRAPFDVYICQQRRGDFVLVPPRSCHQVVNHGKLTIKLSWSRLTIKGAEVALYHELPLYRRVCRAEVYRIKSLIHHAVQRATIQCKEIANAEKGEGPPDDFRVLVQMFHAILVDEYHPDYQSLPVTANSEEDAYFASCDFCGSDILVSFFQCTACPKARSTSEHDVHLCPGCVAEGRSCGCERGMEPMQSWPYEILQSDFNEAVRVLPGNEWRELGACEDPCSLLVQTSGIGLFKAANAINKGIFLRKMRDIIKCAPGRGEPNHEVPSAHSAYCGPCHRSKCLKHWAEKGVHSSMIALAFTFNDNGVEWHRLHLRLSLACEEERLLELEREGRAVDVQLIPERLALFSHLSHVQPLRDGLTLGYYDEQTI